MSNTDINPSVSAEEIKLADQDPEGAASSEAASSSERIYSQSELDDIIAGKRKTWVEKGWKEAQSAYEKEMKPILDSYRMQTQEEEAAGNAVQESVNASSAMRPEDIAQIVRNEVSAAQWNAHLKDVGKQGNSKYSNYGEVTGKLVGELEDPDGKDVIDTALVHPMAHDVLFELGTNPEELQHCKSLKPQALYKRFNSLLAKKQAAGVQPSSPKVVYKETAAPPATAMPSNDAGVARPLSADELTLKVLRGEKI